MAESNSYLLISAVSTMIVVLLSTKISDTGIGLKDLKSPAFGRGLERSLIASVSNL